MNDNIHELDERSRNRLIAIVAKEPHEVTEDEASFLRARRDYLTAEQAETYEDALGGSNPEPVEEEEKVSYKELQTQASDLGLKNVVGVSREALEDFIRTTEGPANAEQPE